MCEFLSGSALAGYHALARRGEEDYDVYLTSVDVGEQLVLHQQMPVA